MSETRPPRRTQAERTQEMQHKLVNCAIELLKKKRYVGLRTAEVAELAGVSKGAQTHHFPAKDMLVLQALEEVYRRTQVQALERIEAARAKPEQTLALLVADSKAFFLGADFLLSLDLVMIDPESPLGQGVKDLARRYRLPVEQAWLDLLTETGYPQRTAQEVVRLTYAMARGFGIRQLITAPDRADDRLFVTWQKMAQAMLDASTSKARSKPRAGHRPTR
ncbi:MAG: TetR/AcrR family transcriptional regulator [Pseudomonadota bacterium]